MRKRWRHVKQSNRITKTNSIDPRCGKWQSNSPFWCTKIGSNWDFERKKWLWLGACSGFWRCFIHHFIYGIGWRCFFIYSIYIYIYTLFFIFFKYMVSVLLGPLQSPASELVARLTGAIPENPSDLKAKIPGEAGGRWEGMARGDTFQKSPKSKIKLQGGIAGWFGKYSIKNTVIIFVWFMYMEHDTSRRLCCEPSRF